MDPHVRCQLDSGLTIGFGSTQTYDMMPGNAFVQRRAIFRYSVIVRRPVNGSKVRLRLNSLFWMTSWGVFVIMEYDGVLGS